ncbi:MAG TPA: endonuclease domain-containing protein [Actinocrinis sp.]|jgi:hypothetical protein|uniref:endonuclease domain-containing protein n=1 Tax=Actinocrinis sp. TaxID=1920516 RepID=UPI002DDD8749|nr:endonuclease domain-containing protein [Actinocrinis sp.]HEV3169142.1 endonuclease domain-containing protein [Actinocrinis sp.]
MEGLAEKRRRDRAAVKPLEEFVVSGRAGGRGTHRKPCQNARTPESRQRLHGGPREYDPKRRYGIGTEDVERILAAQENKCLICDKPDPEHVDRSHKAGKVRVILCFNRNRDSATSGMTCAFWCAPPTI